MDKGYVSEFTVFMNQYLGEHPEALEEQRRGWEFFWNPKMAVALPEKSREDHVPDDNYGFSWSSWRGGYG